MHVSIPKHVLLHTHLNGSAFIQLNKYLTYSRDKT